MTDKEIYRPVILLLIGLILLFCFGHYQDYRRFLTAAGILMTLNSVLVLPFRISSKYYGSSSKHVLIFLLGIIIVIGGMVFSWIKYNDYLLNKSGTITKAIVINKEWLGERSGGYQITYSFNVNQKNIESKK